MKKGDRVRLTNLETISDYTKWRIGNRVGTIVRTDGSDSPWDWVVEFELETKWMRGFRENNLELVSDS